MINQIALELKKRVQLPVSSPHPPKEELLPIKIDNQPFIQPSPPLEGGGRTQAPLNILLADDDVDDRFFFDKALREIPIECQLTIVTDGEQLMDHLSQNLAQLPDVLFLDLSMPRKSGFECLAEIMENPTLKGMAVVMFSTSYTRDMHYEQSMINMLYDIGAQGFIRKPGDFAELKQAIHNTLIKIIEKTGA